MYILGHCGLRGVVKLLTYLNTTLCWGLEQLPCKSTVENWVLKAGYHLYDGTEQSSVEQPYAVLTDECMVVGQERMLAVLGTAAQKQDSQPLCLRDVQVLHLQARASWAHEAIATAIASVSKKKDKAPAYAISDGNGNLVKGCGKAGLVRIADVGHQLALFTEQVYKEAAAFTAFTTALAQGRYKEVMKPEAYLLPPKQRVIARFMNLAAVVSWAEKMLKTQPCLSDKEQQAYGFVKAHRNMIQELGSALGLVKGLLQTLKAEGLSHKTLALCLRNCIQPVRDSCPEGVRKLASKLKGYLQTVKAELPGAQAVWHASSDVLESLFGFYKRRKACNALYGVTPFVLCLPLLTRIDDSSGCINVNFRQALQGVLLSDLQRWAASNLIDNQVMRRTKTFHAINGT